MQKRVCIVAHGRLRTNRNLSEIEKQLGTPIIYTEFAGHAIQLAAKHGRECDILVVAGGDGSVNEVVNGVMSIESDARPAVCIIPLGSGNDVARALGVTSNVDAVVQRINRATPVTWDLIRVEFRSEYSSAAHYQLSDAPHKADSVRYCVNVMSLGLGGRVAQLFNDRLRKLSGHLGYMVAIVNGFSTYRALASTLTITNGVQVQRISSERLLTAVCNSRYFGSGLGIAPDANPSDGVINITDVGAVSVLKYLRHLPGLRKARHLPDDRINYHRATECALDSEHEIPIEIDGDYVGTTPMRATIERAAISMI